jgi:dGTPase
MVAFSAPMAADEAAVKAMLYRAVYRHPRIADVMGSAERAVERLFGRYLDDRAALPETWRPPSGADAPTRARVVADFVAGMTDRYAIGEYRRLFTDDPGLG